MAPVGSGTLFLVLSRSPHRCSQIVKRGWIVVALSFRTFVLEICRLAAARGIGRQ